MWFVERTDRQCHWLIHVFQCTRNSLSIFIVLSFARRFLVLLSFAPLSLSFVEAQTCAHSVCYSMIGCHSCHADRVHQPLILCDPMMIVAHVVPFTVQRETARTSPSARLLQEGTRCRPWKKSSSGHVMFNQV